MDYYRLISAVGIGTIALKTLFERDATHREGMPTGGFKENINSTNVNAKSSGINGQNMTGSQDLSEYISYEYHVSFKYPGHWMRNPRYENKYEGTDGFFEVSGFEADSNNIDDAVFEQINEPYKPYGSNPTIRRLTVSGQPAREIVPSEDQAAIITDRDAALIVQYKKPITVQGKQYQYLIIWTNEANLPLLIRTLRLLEY